MFQYEDLMWLISFPLVCAIMLWFSLDLAVLVRVGGGRRRRANARRAIERLIMAGPVCATTTIAPPPLLPSSLANARGGNTVPSAFPRSRISEDGEQQQLERSAPTSPMRPNPTSPLSSPSSLQNVRKVVVPAALRIATRAVVRRAVVLVGGDFARSPRMQYHAASLARSGLFDEILLVGLDCGNQLSEDLLMSGEPQLGKFPTIREGAGRGAERAVYDVDEQLRSSRVQSGHGCIISARYLTAPPTPPEWLQTVFPLRSLHWVACTVYRVAALTLLFTVQATRSIATRVNEHGQLLVTDLVLIQSPPAIPFVLLIKYVVCPLAFLYNSLLYYGVVVPAAWMNPAAMRDVRQQCRLQSLRFRAEVAASTNSPTPAPTLSNGIGECVDGSRNPSTATNGTVRLASLCVRPSLCSRIRPWIFYPAIVVDWHNFGYTILEQAQRPTSAVQLYKLLEVNLCAGDVNVTVSAAMRRAIEGFYPSLAINGSACEADVDASTRKAEENGESTENEVDARGVTVLYDVAPAFFRPVSRRRCVRAVLDRLLLPSVNAGTHSSQHRTPVSINNGGGSGSNPYPLISKEALEGLGWGIAGPPAWVYAEAAAMADSVPSSPLSPSVSAPDLNAVHLNSAANTTGNTGGGMRRGIMVIGSTSWTEDDDYSVLIRALQRLDHRLNHEVTSHTTSGNGNYASGGGGTSSGNNSAGGSSSQPLDLWVLITGKGPARQRFEEAVRSVRLSPRVTVSTYYAQSYQEYSVLLGAADVGFCLHYSSSGLDLPMKGVDMVGAGLPVIALQYPAIEELMGGATRVLAQTRTIPRSNGYAITAAHRAPCLVECARGWIFQGDVDLEVLLASFVGLSRRGGCSGAANTLPPTPLPVMHRRAQEARQEARTWTENWDRTLLPVLKQVV